jgi:hypothetical protein
VTPGKLADLIIVDGDPLADPGLLSDPARIWLVLQAGFPVAGQALSKPPPGAPERRAGPGRSLAAGPTRSPG